ncbi:L-lactate dehydrogenase [Schleiferilactobacillus harbinensis]|uniref:L-2-hydroxyisocaproate dehydrogenase n=1 Tax=Schleiferilactobacillus harbinensis DSM 16991 TaxID=1122147 RepID=A0A0R1X7X6_9LACO|nr:L-2-hydroxyisocaproate dehydrogenase [Schleiferilactobacillus harbinensis]KRM23446.1 L-2-hydroxyisocaproate dehydrogenase [Schleiferilactobacillus harbinensis DSM 16991]QFR64211.1 L-lactate dehydrogenase [Schleiferilactobacillus harbinensis]
MARTIGVIGIGHVGVTTSFNIVTKGLADTLLMIDTKPGWAEAERLDLQDSLGGLNTYTRIVANDYSLLRDADVVIFSGGDISVIKDGDRNSEIKTTKAAIDDAAPKLTAAGFHGVLIDISNPCDVAVTYWQEKLDLHRNQIIGTGTALDTYRMRRAVAEAMNVNVADVRGFNLGEHGESQFTAWSTVRVNNEPVKASPDFKEKDLAEAARLGGWQIFNAKHYTNFGIATIACEMALAVMSDAGRIFPCSSYDPQYGVSIGHPTMIGRAGVISNPPMHLTGDEVNQYAHSADTIKENLAKLHALD